MFDLDWTHLSQQMQKLWKASTVTIWSKCAFGGFCDKNSFQSAFFGPLLQKKGRWNPFRQLLIGDKQLVLKALVTDEGGESTLQAVRILFQLTLLWEESCNRTSSHSWKSLVSAQDGLVAGGV